MFRARSETKVVLHCAPWTWASKAGGGRDGGTRPPQSKNQRGRPPRNHDVSVSFSLTHMQILHFPTFSKKVAEIRGETKYWG